MKISIDDMKKVINDAEKKNHTHLSFDMIDREIYTGIKAASGWVFYGVENIKLK